MPSHKQRPFFFALEDEASKRAKALHTKPTDVPDNFAVAQVGLDKSRRYPGPLRGARRDAAKAAWRRKH